MKEHLKIKEMSELAGKQNGCRIYDIYRHRDRLQVFIDKKSENLAVSLKDCENVFYSLRFLLDSELPHILENRRLEISSPGIEKHLREKWHFEESIGEKMKLVTTDPIEAYNTKTDKKFSSRSFTACLVSVSEEELSFEDCFLKYSVPFLKIKSAKLIFNNLKSPKLESLKTNLYKKKKRVKK